MSVVSQRSELDRKEERPTRIELASSAWKVLLADFDELL
jgi:hypothetical protein